MADPRPVDPANEPLPPEAGAGEVASGNKLEGKRIGRFRLIRKLGKGGMASVLLGEDPRLKRPVALKVIPAKADKPDQKVYLEQFVREARAAAQLVHPYIVQIFEVGQASGCAYIAMEVLEMGNLDDMVRQNGTLPVHKACEWVSQAAEAIAYAHEQGIIHRDLKPANLMLTKGGHCKVADFGVAHLDDPDDPARNVWKVVGTPYYQAPEVLAGKFSPQSDIFALGATLWVLLTGKPPFDIQAPGDVARLHVDFPLPDLLRIRPDVPRGLAAIIERCLARFPQERFRDASELARELKAYAGQDGASRGGSPPPPAAVSRPRMAPAPNRAAQSRIMVWAVVATGVFVLVGMIVIVVVFSRGEPRRAPVAEAPTAAPVVATPEPAPTPVGPVVAAAASPTPEVVTPAATATPGPTPADAGDAAPALPPEILPEATPTATATPVSTTPVKDLVVERDIVELALLVAKGDPRYYRVTGTVRAAPNTSGQRWNVSLGSSERGKGLMLYFSTSLAREVAGKFNIPDPHHLNGRSVVVTGPIVWNQDKSGPAMWVRKIEDIEPGASSAGSGGEGKPGDKKPAARPTDTPEPTPTPIEGKETFDVTDAAAMKKVKTLAEANDSAFYTFRGRVEQLVPNPREGLIVFLRSPVRCGAIISPAVNEDLEKRYGKAGKDLRGKLVRVTGRLETWGPNKVPVMRIDDLTRIEDE